MNISQLRVEALRALIGDLKTKEFADRHNLDASYLSQLLNGHRPLGDKAAKNLEDKIGLTGGTLLMPARSAQDGLAPEINQGPSLIRGQCRLPSLWCFILCHCLSPDAQISFKHAFYFIIINPKTNLISGYFPLHSNHRKPDKTMTSVRSCTVP